jgi:hypothetical protein
MQALNSCLIFYSKQTDARPLKNGRFCQTCVLPEIENERERRRESKDAVSGNTQP